MSEPAGARPATDRSGAGAPATTRLSDEVAERIRALIMSEDVAEGARLPSERDLAERLGTSRPTVSQALRSLSLMGMVEIRRGSGAYVLRRPETMITASVNLMLDLDRESVDHLAQLRLWLETIGVREAATRRPGLDEAEASQIRSSLDHLCATTTNASELIAADTLFHAAVARCAGNPYLAALYESVHTAVLSYEFQHWIDTESEPAWFSNRDPEQRWALHEPIANAVLARDADAAEAAVTAHHRVLMRNLDLVRSAAPDAGAR